MIVTAEALAEIIDNKFYQENHYYWSQTEPITFAQEVAIQFAKLHLEEALKIAAKDVHYTTTRDKYRNITGVEINKDSILNSYPLENIK